MATIRPTVLLITQASNAREENNKHSEGSCALYFYALHACCERGGSFAATPRKGSDSGKGEGILSVHFFQSLSNIDGE